MAGTSRAGCGGIGTGFVRPDEGMLHLCWSIGQSDPVNLAIDDPVSRRYYHAEMARNAQAVESTVLTKFSVNNYKCLVGVELPLTPIHVIIGQNDSGKTSLLEAMLALSRSAEDDLPQAFGQNWRGRELVNSAASDPQIKFEADFLCEADNREYQYLFDAVFHSKVRECSQRREWAHKVGQNLTVDGALPTRVMHWNHQSLPLLNSLAELMGPAHYYRLDPKAMALPAATDVNRKFRMDVDGFGLSTILDDITGYDAERFLSLRREFCEYFPQFQKVGIETQTAYARGYDDDGVIVSATKAPGKEIFFETRDGAKVRAQRARR